MRMSSEFVRLCRMLRNTHEKHSVYALTFKRIKRIKSDTAMERYSQQSQSLASHCRWQSELFRQAKEQSIDPWSENGSGRICLIVSLLLFVSFVNFFVIFGLFVTCSPSLCSCWLKSFPSSSCTAYPYLVGHAYTRTCFVYLGKNFVSSGHICTTCWSAQSKFVNLWFKTMLKSLDLYMD